jgi:hypothetical protein
MAQLNQWPSEREDAYHNGWSDYADATDSPSLHLNVLTGVVTSRTIGLTRTTVRVRVGERTDLRVRWQADSPAHGTVNIGDTVHLTIPPEAIQLEAGGFRRSKQRWNRWIGRVVLVNRHGEAPVTIVKLHRDHITLNSIGLVMGAQAPLTVWDTVNIVVDPHQVSLTPVRHPYSQVIPELSPSPSPVDSHPSRIWLRATIRSIQSTPAGLLVTLNVGDSDMSLSAVIEFSPAILSPWSVGASVGISIYPPDPLIRQSAEGPRVPRSIVRSSENGVLQHSVPIHRTQSRRSQPR